MEKSRPPFLLILLPLLLSHTLTTSSLSPAIPHSESPSSPSPSSSPSPLKPKPPTSPSPTKSPSPVRPKPPTSPSPTKSPSPVGPKPPTSPSPTKTPSPLPPKPSSSPSTLDPKQLLALQSLNIPTSKDPCSQPSLHNATLCDAGKPFRHLRSLRLTNCSDDVELSITALRSLSTLQDLEFSNCPINLVRLPPELIANLHSFTCINSLHRLTGVWLSRLQNLTDLTVSGVKVNASGPSIILGGLKKLRSVTISHTNLTGYLPKRWHLNITHIDLSGNELKGKIPTSLTHLADLKILNLSSNALTGEIPSSFGDLSSLQNLSFASNSLSGSIPDSMLDIPGLVHLDLSSNQFNGTIPRFISEMKRLKYLNIEKNNFHGVMPFNVSFINRLAVFKVGGNSNLCYNHSILSSTLKLGIARCDKEGLPVSPPPEKEDSTAGSDNTGNDDSEDDTASDKKPKEGHRRGPSKIVLGVAIGLSSIVFLIIFLVLLSKWCG